MNRRQFLGVAAMAAGSGAAQSLPGVQPITETERAARIEKARRLMRQHKLDAIFLEPGSTLFYYTGRPAGSDERILGWVLPAKGEPAWTSPDLQPAQVFKDRGVSTGRIGIEEQVRFFVFDGIRKQAPALEYASATPVTAGCRMIKSPAEIALMQRANDITIAAFRFALAKLREPMTQAELRADIAAGYREQGLPGGGALIGFGKASAFPHGSVQPQLLHEGDIVLIDGGCSIEGYQSDITRTTVFGKATARQKQIWDLERKAQDAAFAAARTGATCESVDAAARKVITDAGFGPDYKVPGLPHRTGHGIGLDGHEWTNLVRGNKTRLAPGMCFSDEPMIAIYGEFGIRLEDCFYMAEGGPRFFTKQSLSIDQPFG
ncbi:MAG: M24 family metallopeptidase [Bryobacteraceae bacterium]